MGGLGGTVSLKAMCDSTKLQGPETFFAYFVKPLQDKGQLQSKEHLQALFSVLLMISAHFTFGDVTLQLINRLETAVEAGAAKLWLIDIDAHSSRESSSGSLCM